jgi:hypothetical protein
MERLREPEVICCKSISEDDAQKHACDCGLMGAVIHMAVAMHLEIETWVGLRQDDDFSADTSDSLAHLINQLENMRTFVISSSGISERDVGAHRDCTPWTSFTVEDIFAEHRVKDLIPINESLFVRRALAAGLLPGYACDTWGG